MCHFESKGPSLSYAYRTLKCEKFPFHLDVLVQRKRVTFRFKTSQISLCPTENSDGKENFHIR